MKYHFKIHKEDKGYWAECIEIPGCFTQGDTKEKLLENMQEAINTFLEEPEDSQYIAPLPKTSIRLSHTVVEVQVDPGVAFAFSIREQRIKQGMTQRQAAKKLGLKGLFSYQRLERKCNPSLNLIVRLVWLFPALSLDQILH